MKYLTILIIFASSLFSLTINDTVLRIHATLIPKISLMDYEYKEKCIDSKIVINLVYEKINYLSALSMKEQINKKYKDGIGEYKVITRLVAYNQLNKKKANVYYLFPSNSKNIQKIIKLANKNGALTFSYLKKDLKYGVMMSLNIGAQVKPILNLNAIKTNNITFRPVLLDISTIYVEDKESILKDIEGFYKHKIYIANTNFSIANYEYK